MAFVLDSPAFGDGDPVPVRCTQDGDNVSPPLEWRDPPPGTRSFALIVEDPDAPTGVFRHWAVYDIPGDRWALPEGAGSDGGPHPHMANDFGRRRYDGPAPPPGHGRHSYHFRLAALRVAHLDPPEGATAADLRRVMGPHLLGEAELVATYKRMRGEAAAAEGHDRPSKGDPVVVAGDAGGPNDGRNLTTADLDHDAGQPEPDRLEPAAYRADKPKGSESG